MKLNYIFHACFHIIPLYYFYIIIFYNYAVFGHNVTVSLRLSFQISTERSTRLNIFICISGCFRLKKEEKIEMENVNLRAPLPAFPCTHIIFSFVFVFLKNGIIMEYLFIILLFSVASPNERFKI